MTDPQAGDPRRDDGTSDEELVAQVRAGDVAAYAVLYERHGDAAIHYARRVSGADGAQDVAQESFLKVLSAILAGRGPQDGFVAYLLRVVRNEAVDRARRTRETPVEDVHEVGGDDLVVLDGAACHAEREVLRSALAELPHTQREVLWLTEVEGLAPRDVAPRLDMSANAVSQLARRGREGLRAAWLQAQVDTREARPECRRTVASLGAYERGRLSSARQAAVDRHLDECADCTARLAQLRRLSGRMRGILVPLVLSSPELLRSQFSPASAAGATGATGAGALPVVEGARTALTGTLATLGSAAVVVAGAAVVLHPTDGPPEPGHARATATSRSKGGSTTDPGATGSSTPVEAPSAEASPGGSGTATAGTGATEGTQVASTSSTTSEPGAGPGSEPGEGPTDPAGTGVDTAVSSAGSSGTSTSSGTSSTSGSGSSSTSGGTGVSTGEADDEQSVTTGGASGPTTEDPASSPTSTDESTEIPEPRSSRGPTRRVDPVPATRTVEEPTTAPTEGATEDASVLSDGEPTDEQSQGPVVVPIPSPVPLPTSRPSQEPLKGPPARPPETTTAPPTDPPASGAGGDAEDDQGEDEG